MADLQIHELSALGRDVKNTDLFAVDTGTATRKLTYSSLSAKIINPVAQAMQDLSTEVAYRRIVGPSETTVFVHEYSVGQIFQYGSKLYIATAPISIGDTLTVGTNCAETTLAQLLDDANAKFATITATQVSGDDYMLAF